MTDVSYSFFKVCLLLLYVLNVINALDYECIVFFSEGLLLIKITNLTH